MIEVKVCWALHPSVGTWLGRPLKLQQLENSIAVTLANPTEKANEKPQVWALCPSVGTWLARPPRLQVLGKSLAVTVEFPAKTSEKPELGKFTSVVLATAKDAARENEAASKEAPAWHYEATRRARGEKKNSTNSENPARELVDFFSAGYFNGGWLKSPRYKLEYDSELGTDIYHHLESGVRIWTHVLDLSNGAASTATVLHYTSTANFKIITNAEKGSAEVWTALSCRRAAFGFGIYGCTRGPEDIHNIEALLTHSYIASYIELVEDERRLGPGVCCIPVRGSSIDVVDVHHQTTPAMIHGPGLSVKGEPVAGDVDIKVLHLADTQSAVYASATNLVEMRRTRLARVAMQLGADHEKTLRSRHDLASVLVAKHDYASAEELHREVLIGRIRLLGGEHQDTLWTKKSLGALLIRRKDLSSGEVWIRDVLAAQERNLGYEHIDTLRTKGILAIGMMRRRDYDSAEALFRQVLQGFERALCESHDDILRTKERLAIVLSERRDYQGAEVLLKQILAVQEREFGFEDVRSLDTRGNLARVLAESGNLVGAEDLNRKVLAAQERVLGRSHPSTIRTKRNLATTLSERGDTVAADNLEQELENQARQKTGLQRIGKDSPSRPRPKKDSEGGLLHVDDQMCCTLCPTQ